MTRYGVRSTASPQPPACHGSPTAAQVSEHKHIASSVLSSRASPMSPSPSSRFWLAPLPNPVSPVIARASGRCITYCMYVQYHDKPFSLPQIHHGPERSSVLVSVNHESLSSSCGRSPFSPAPGTSDVVKAFNCGQWATDHAIAQDEVAFSTE